MVRGAEVEKQLMPKSHVTQQSWLKIKHLYRYFGKYPMAHKVR